MNIPQKLINALAYKNLKIRVVKYEQLDELAIFGIIDGVWCHVVLHTLEDAYKWFETHFDYQIEDAAALYDDGENNG